MVINYHVFFDITTKFRSREFLNTHQSYDICTLRIELVYFQGLVHYNNILICLCSYWLD